MVSVTSSAVAGQLPVSTKILANGVPLMRTLRNSVARLRSARARMVRAALAAAGGSPVKVNSRGDAEPMAPAALVLQRFHLNNLRNLYLMVVPF